ncbi:MAG TPA: MFS transporter [Gammaproteobacteria bacterium]|nr:MFS transporter [Gammaproteobacteria bacterium]
MTQKQNTTDALTNIEKRSITGLASIFALRMLGLFMIFPVFSVAANQYHGATPFLIGIAIGAYGLTQAIFQVPFGMLSDRIGRKKVITLGLLLFALGSVVAAMASSIELVILGRLLQGSGAISAATMALTADLTRDEHRTKAMATIGISIGLSFSLALAFGALLEGVLGLAGIFWLTAILALLGIAILHLFIPTPEGLTTHRDMAPIPTQLRTVLSNSHIMRLVLSILMLHLILTMSFYGLPIALEQAGIASTAQASVYLPILLLAFISMIPLIVVAEKKRKMKPVFLTMISLLLVTQLIWSQVNTSFAILFGLWLFFTAFNLLEATLPSMMSKLSPLENKGTALGVYATAQFIGVFIGGSLGGLLYKYYDLHGLFLCGVILSAVWLLVVLPMQPPRHLTTKIIQLTPPIDPQQITAQLNAINGVIETMIVSSEKVAYVKYIPEQVDSDALNGFST